MKVYVVTSEWGLSPEIETIILGVFASKAEAVKYADERPLNSEYTVYVVARYDTDTPTKEGVDVHVRVHPDRNP